MKCTLLICLVCAFGCQQTAVTGTHLRLEMTAPYQAVLFLVDDEGVSYGGGLSAIENKTTWHGAMTGEQQSTFDVLISESNWLTMESREPQATGLEVTGSTYEVAQSTTNLFFPLKTLQQLPFTTCCNRLRI